MGTSTWTNKLTAILHPIPYLKVVLLGYSVSLIPKTTFLNCEGDEVATPPQSLSRVVHARTISSRSSKTLHWSPRKWRDVAYGAGSKVCDFVLRKQWCAHPSVVSLESPTSLTCSHCRCYGTLPKKRTQKLAHRKPTKRHTSNPTRQWPLESHRHTRPDTRPSCRETLHEPDTYSIRHRDPWSNRCCPTNHKEANPLQPVQSHGTSTQHVTTWYRQKLM